jgi:hypothetical protein
MKKPKRVIRIRSEHIKTGEDGTITITQGTRTYPAQAREIAGEEYFVVVSPLTGTKVWIQARFED